MRPLPPALSELEADLGFAAGDLTDPDKTRAERALQKATTLVLAEAPAKADAWTVDAPAIVELVVLTAARRGFENPRGIQQETLGAHTVGLSESTGVYLTARELQQVRRAATGQRKGFVGSVRTPSAYADDPEAADTVYLGVTGQEPVPVLSIADLVEYGS
ncbi:head-to-tail adaptor [Microbacterium phage Honk]|uniref:Head-to-tail adaptor n=1 Tax=Microbacterium phage Honk TaxID=2836095 RepID=A0A8F3IMS0_9CAUD|nr:head-to-tail adaptor [Microbacterium phage Honk]